MVESRASYVYDPSQLSICCEAVELRRNRRDYDPFPRPVSPQGLRNPGTCCVAGVGNKRKFGDVIVNDVRPNARPAQVKTGCKECRKALCTAKSCWDNWHAQKWL